MEVHRELARATGNRVYVLLTNTLFNAYLPVRASLRAPFEDAARAADRLAPVVRAVVDRDGEEARRAAETYLAVAEKIMLGSGCEQFSRASDRRRSPVAALPGGDQGPPAPVEARCVRRSGPSLGMAPIMHGCPFISRFVHCHA